MGPCGGLCYPILDLSIVRLNDVPRQGIVRQNRTDLERQPLPNSDGNLTPLGEGSRTVFLEIGSRNEMALEVEAVVVRRVLGSEFLQALISPGPGHGFLASS